ncbi:unnamed protein product [Closterium sp. Naga37s-1]|nr:unnamed protein product [Closterium sp. Naga37s-1]
MDSVSESTGNGVARPPTPVESGGQLQTVMLDTQASETLPRVERGEGATAESGQHVRQQRLLTRAAGAGIVMGVISNPARAHVNQRVPSNRPPTEIIDLDELQGRLPPVGAPFGPWDALDPMEPADAPQVDDSEPVLEEHPAAPPSNMVPTPNRPFTHVGGRSITTANSATSNRRRGNSASTAWGGTARMAGSTSRNPNPLGSTQQAERAPSVDMGAGNSVSTAWGGTARMAGSTSRNPNPLGSTQQAERAPSVDMGASNSFSTAWGGTARMAGSTSRNPNPLGSTQQAEPAPSVDMGAHNSGVRPSGGSPPRSRIRLVSPEPNVHHVQETFQEARHDYTMAPYIPPMGVLGVRQVSSGAAQSSPMLAMESEGQLSGQASPAASSRRRPRGLRGSRSSPGQGGEGSGGMETRSQGFVTPEENITNILGARMQEVVQGAVNLGCDRFERLTRELEHARRGEQAATRRRGGTSDDPALERERNPDG